MTNVGQLVASKKHYRHKVDTINVKEIFSCVYSIFCNGKYYTKSIKFL